MKKLFIPILVLMPIGANAVAVAKICTEIVCTSTDVTSVGCSAADARCYQNSSTGLITQIADCTECQTGYELTSTSTTCGVLTIPYNKCQTTCADCTDCTSDTSWTTAEDSSGLVIISHQQKIIRTCDCGTCIETPEYRCAAGYYGTPTSLSDGCYRCPSSGVVYGTSAAGSTEITSCYMPSETSMTDDSGTFQFTSDCYYSE